MAKLILALDCATKTGWSLTDYNSGKVIESGMQDFKKRRGEGNGAMFLRFRKWLNDLFSDNPGIALLAYEQAHHRGGAATEICVGMTTRVQEAAADMEVVSVPCHTTELKLFATGKGNAGKQAMIDAATKVLGRIPVDDNEADAVHIGQWAKYNYGA